MSSGKPRILSGAMRRNLLCSLALLLLVAAGLLMAGLASGTVDASSVTTFTFTFTDPDRVYTGTDGSKITVPGQTHVTSATATVPTVTETVPGSTTASTTTTTSTTTPTRSTTTSTSTSTSTTTTTPPPPPGLGLPKYGTANGSHYPFRSSADQDFEVAQEVALGSKLMRVDCAPGGNTTAVNKIVAAGVEPVCLLGQYGYPASFTPAGFAFTCSNEATALKGRARVFETTNEPDLHGWTGHGAEWAPYQKACYQAIKAAQPNALVLSPGLFEGPTGNTALVDFVRDYYAAGGGPYVSAWAIHLYGDPAVCGSTRSIWAQTFGCAGGIYATNNVRAVLNANGDAGKAIVCTECGARVSSAADEPWQAGIVTRVLQATDGIGTGNRKLAFTLIYDVIDDEVVGYGLLRPDRSRRPSFSAFQAVTAAGG